MGMYDHVKVEHESMSAAWRAHLFQTKDLGTEGADGNLDTFTITADGRLLRRQWPEDLDLEYEALSAVEWQLELYDFETSDWRSAPLMHFFAKFKGNRLAGPIEGPFVDGRRPDQEART